MFSCAATGKSATGTLLSIEVRGPRKSELLWGNIAGSSLVSRSKKHCASCAVISAAVAHLVERHLAKVEVASSSLVSRSKKKTPVIDRCFLFGIRGNLTTFGRQSRPKVDAATRPRLASARRRFAVSYAAPVGRSLTKSVLDGRIWCLWTGRHPGWPAVRYPLAQNPKHFGEQICVRYSPAISRKRQTACAPEVCKNRHPSPICMQFGHHPAGVSAPLSRSEAPMPYNWFSTAIL